jgi:hypothetical protein
MNAVSASPRTIDADRDSGMSLRRILFILTVALAGALFWIAPRPPMGDLPQHAGQIALLHDLLTGVSPWADLVRVNYFTPYLLGYGLAFALSFVMPVLAAMKLLMMLAFYAYVAAGVMLRKEFQADARLDWLYVPGFFGFAYQYGFYTFLLAAPVGLFFLILARRFAMSPTPSRGLGVALAGVIVFFSHGLVFIFSCALGVAFIPFLVKGVARMARAMLPYVMLGLLTIAYLSYVRHAALIIPRDPTQLSPATIWDWTGPFGWHRIYNFVLYAVATEMKDGFFLLGTVFMLAAPWLLGARFNRRDPTALLPMIAIVFVWLFAPTEALGIALLYQRFAIFLLPAYAIMFRAADPAGSHAATPVKEMATKAILALFCWSYLSVLAIREHRFAIQNAPFETLMSAAESGQRALSLVFAPESTIVHNLWTYHTYPLWYQAERQGFVDFNFAFFLPQIVRFRPDRIPPVRPGPKESSVEGFDWHAVEGRAYRYFFVRHTVALPPRLFDNDECEVVLIKAVPDWSLFERRACH